MTNSAYLLFRFEITAAITRGSAERLGLKQGDTVTAVIKATDVLIDK